MSLQLLWKRSTVYRAVKMSLITGRRALNRSALSLRMMSPSSQNPPVCLLVTLTPLLPHLLSKTDTTFTFLLHRFRLFSIITIYSIYSNQFHLYFSVIFLFDSFRIKAPAKTSKPKVAEASSKSGCKNHITLYPSQIIS